MPPRSAASCATRASRSNSVSPCYYGIDTPHSDELIASTHSVAEIREFLGADTLAYLSLDGLQEAVGPRHNDYCNACYTRQYPVGGELLLSPQSVEIIKFGDPGRGR